jgi:hypothetical protein
MTNRQAVAGISIGDRVMGTWLVHRATIFKNKRLNQISPCVVYQPPPVPPN